MAEKANRGQEKEVCEQGKDFLVMSKKTVVHNTEYLPKSRLQIGTLQSGINTDFIHEQDWS